MAEAKEEFDEASVLSNNAPYYTMMVNNEKELNKLKLLLDELYSTYDESFLASDPLELVHDFKKAADIEIAALITSSLAYGKVAQIKKSVRAVFHIMENKPYAFTMGFEPRRDKNLFKGFIHRFNDGKDISCLIFMIRQMIEAEGSIEGFFLKGYDEADKNIKNALTSFTERTLKLDSANIYGTKELPLPKDAGVRYFFPSPAKGSGCKRLNLFLRWMIRSSDDGLDLGVWKKIPPNKLIIPLDTHIGRIAKLIGLTEINTPSWRMAEEITESLARLDPEDPVKYDFALSRLGILDECPSRVDKLKCRACPIKGLCVMTKARDK
jgi:uncharacterized protein (TIGR02757 family)